MRSRAFAQQPAVAGAEPLSVPRAIRMMRMSASQMAFTVSMPPGLIRINYNRPDAG
jgi:hypothetical protein